MPIRPTLRGFLLLTLGLVCLVGPGLTASDLVATAIGITLLTLLGCFLLLHLSLYFRLKQRLRVSIVDSQAQMRIYSGRLVNCSGRPFSLILRINDLALPAFFSASITLPSILKLRTSTLVLTGMKSRRQETLEVIAEHRGSWELSDLRLEVQDQLGLIILAKRIFLEGGSYALRVYPPVVDLEPYSIENTSVNSGDLSPFVEKRSGDYYDFRSYDPSDGSNRILWKLFARSGKLMARQPERSIDPEGKIALLLLAGPSEDHVCSAALHVAKDLSDSGIEFFADAANLRGEGLASRSAGGLPAKLLSEAEELFVSGVVETPNQRSEREALNGTISSFHAAISEGENAQAGRSNELSILLVASPTSLSAFTSEFKHSLSTGGFGALRVLLVSQRAEQKLKGTELQLSHVWRRMFFESSEGSGRPKARASEGGSVSKAGDWCSKMNIPWSVLTLR